MQVLLAPGVRELVEHDDLVAVVADAQADEVRADEAGAAADEQLHARTALRVRRGRRRAPPARRQQRAPSSRSLASALKAGRGAGRGNSAVVHGQHAAVDAGLAEDLDREVVPRARAAAGDVEDALRVASRGELDAAPGRGGRSHVGQPIWSVDDA